MKAETSYPDFEAIKQQERAAYLLAGYFQYDLNAEEEEELDKWITSSDANLKLFEELTDETRMAEYLRWYSSRDVEMHLQEARKKVQLPRHPRSLKWWKYAAAAVILVTGGLLVYLLRPSQVTVSNPGYPFLKLTDGSIIPLVSKDTMLNDYARIHDGVLVYDLKAVTSKKQELVAPRKTSGRLVLPDGTKVWLNAASSIIFPGTFDGDAREVIITGECYFEIAKQHAPFIVSVNGVKVQATGTAFNIKAYPNDPYLRITLTEGSVKVTSEKNTLNVGVDEQLQIGNSGEWDLKKHDTEKTIAWIDNKLALDDASVEELKGYLERLYDVEVIIQDKVDKHFNATFLRSIPLTTLLNHLEGTKDVHFKVEGNRVTVLK